MGVIDELLLIIDQGKSHFLFALSCVAILWGVHFINVLLRYRLNFLGILPRHLLGLPGIVCAPFLHASFDHLFLNSIPALILIDLVCFYGIPFFFALTLYLIFFSGLAIWLFGRKACHVGASALILGYWGFLLAGSYYQPSGVSVILALICLFYLASLAFNLLPIQKGASWEGHVFGCLAGMSFWWVAPHLTF